MKRILIFINVILVVLLISCGSSSVKLISSANDGPYIYYEGETAGVIILDSFQKADTVYINKELLPATVFRCIFDSLSCPPLEFQLHSADPSDTDSIAMPDKLIAVSDIEGNFDKFYKLLYANRVIDKNCNWIFGNGQLVILGDLVDRGDYVTQCLWLIYKLERQAESSGGKVHYLLGNHERMIMTGDGRYVSEKYKPVFEKLQTDVSKLFSNSTELGRWLRSKNTLLKAGNLLFVHAGMSPELLQYDLSINRINTEIRRDFDSKVLKTKESEFLLSKFGILWYRGLVDSTDDYQKISVDNLDGILKKYKAEAIVVGHTIVDSVSTDYSGKVIRADVYHYDKCEALLIENGIYYSVDESGIKRKL